MVDGLSHHTVRWATTPVEHGRVLEPRIACEGPKARDTAASALDRLADEMVALRRRLVVPVVLHLRGCGWVVISSGGSRWESLGAIGSRWEPTTACVVRVKYE